ncbi:TPA: HD domain-containing protein [Photobacterium damselae]|uniref:HD domain-containing protein n=1 Tax=Photobacterium damselae TaxID=38293 RepID=UPI0012453C08|nr:HD domain-containing protein [Photobacterium damselae]KAB1182721.1 HD domain-containing protein [Photobacterium damselae subsp. damselae]
MQFDKNLTGKILDPIHGLIRLTELELDFIDHPLFQRLRNIKQNTFLYKVFPSAMHSRFEHSLGVMHLSYEILDNMSINAYRYKRKYEDNLIFTELANLPTANIQELRLAAIMHDIGHGPMSHQFDAFMCDKTEFQSYFGKDYPQIVDLIDDCEHVEHEHISLLFTKIIYDSLPEEKRCQINIDNVLSIIEKDYQKEILVELEGRTLDVLPLFTSIISSCPIDADRMDYLLRDSYFSGVKCGIYDYNRLFMSMVPVVAENAVYLAYKESGLDSIVEFINARANLFGQVYYHKTNRSFSSMLSKVCKLAKEHDSEVKLFDFTLPTDAEQSSYLEQIQKFYLDNSDDYFLNDQLEFLIGDIQSAVNITNDIITRKPWRKVYESKIYPSGLSITNTIDKDNVKLLESIINNLITDRDIDSSIFTVDVMTDNAFKDIAKTEIKLLEKQLDGTYSIRKFKDSNYKLARYQSIKCFVRIFAHKSISEQFDLSLIQSIDEAKDAFLKENSLVKILAA